MTTDNIIPLFRILIDHRLIPNGTTNFSGYYFYWLGDIYVQDLEWSKKLYLYDYDKNDLCLVNIVIDDISSMFNFETFNYFNIQLLESTIWRKISNSI